MPKFFVRHYKFPPKQQFIMAVVIPLTLLALALLIIITTIKTTESRSFIEKEVYSVLIFPKATINTLYEKGVGGDVIADILQRYTDKMWEAYGYDEPENANNRFLYHLEFTENMNVFSGRSLQEVLKNRPSINPRVLMDARVSLRERKYVFGVRRGMELGRDISFVIMGLADIEGKVYGGHILYAPWKFGGLPIINISTIILFIGIIIVAYILANLAFLIIRKKSDIAGYIMVAIFGLLLLISSYIDLERFILNKYSYLAEYCQYVYNTMTETVKISTGIDLKEEPRFNEEVIKYLNAGASWDKQEEDFSISNGNLSFTTDFIFKKVNQHFMELLIITVMISILFFGMVSMINKGLVDDILNAMYNYATAYMLGLLGSLILFILIFIPLFYSILLSFTSIDRYLRDINIFRNFAGFKNYYEIFVVDFLRLIGKVPPIAGRENVNFYYNLSFNLLYAFIATLLQVILGIILAVILNDRKLKLRGIYQTLLLIPWVIPTYISGLLWRNMFVSPGIFNQVLKAVGLGQVEWFGNTTSGLLTLAFVAAWYGFPFVMVVTLSALQSIPESVTESALIDGAGFFTRMFRIYLPMIRTVVLPSIMLSFIWTFNNFNLVYLIIWKDTRFDILITRIYAFLQRVDWEEYTYGYIAAYSVITFLMLMILILVFARLTRVTEREY